MSKKVRGGTVEKVGFAFLKDDECILLSSFWMLRMAGGVVESILENICITPPTNSEIKIVYSEIVTNRRAVLENLRVNEKC